MCATFLLSSEDSAEIKNICDELSKKYGSEAANKAFNADLYPKSSAAVIGPSLKPALLSWGFPLRASGTLFNARAESLKEKSVYQSILANRCLIPATSFYEWDSAKRKYSFSVSSGLFYMAGLWKAERQRDGSTSFYFTIITTEPNSVVGNIHKRMPAIIPTNDAEEWLKGSESFKLLRPYVGEMELAAV